MAKCEDLEIFNISTVKESKPHCDREKAIADLVDQLLSVCEERRAKKGSEWPPCHTVKCDGDAHCLDYIPDKSLKEIEVKATRDPTCPEGRVHFVAYFSGLLQCGCNCAKLVGKEH